MHGDDDARSGLEVLMPDPKYVVSGKRLRIISSHLEIYCACGLEAHEIKWPTVHWAVL